MKYDVADYDRPTPHAMFDDALHQIRDLQRRAERLHGEHQVTLPELFPDEFMLRNTEFPSISALLEASGHRIESSEDFAAIPEADWDGFIASRTRFASWEEMKRSAATTWARQRLLGFD